MCLLVSGVLVWSTGEVFQSALQFPNWFDTTLLEGPEDKNCVVFRADDLLNMIDCELKKYYACMKYNNANA